MGAGDWRMVDESGAWRMEGGWRMADGGWRMRVADGGCHYHYYFDLVRTRATTSTQTPEATPMNLNNLIDTAEATPMNPHVDPFIQSIVMDIARPEWDADVASDVVLTSDSPNDLISVFRKGNEDRA